MEGGFIKLSRKMLEWEWYTDQKTMSVFLHCLLKANWKQGRFRGIEVPRGSFITSLPSLCEELNMSTQSVRTAIDHLKSTGEITVKIFPHWRMITVVKYNDYQEDNRLDNSQVTGNQQASNRQVTAIEEYKNYKNGKKGRYMPTQGVLMETPEEELNEIENLYLEEVKNDKL